MPWRLGSLLRKGFREPQYSQASWQENGWGLSFFKMFWLWIKKLKTVKLHFCLFVFGKTWTFSTPNCQNQPSFLFSDFWWKSQNFGGKYLFHWKPNFFSTDNFWLSLTQVLFVACVKWGAGRGTDPNTFSSCWWHLPPSSSIDQWDYLQSKAWWNISKGIRI